MISTILACATCASNFQDDGPNAAGWSILFMLAVILPLLLGVSFFMARIIFRGEKSLDPELRDDYPAPATR